METPVLQILLASTRPGRKGAAVAHWFQSVAEKHGGFSVELLDLAEINLPLLDEPNHPRLHQYVHQHTKDWSATIARGDAYVFVMPEYNYGISAPLKNAIDYLFLEWQHKPVGLISYGGVSGGLRAAQMTRQVVAALSMTPLTEAVVIPNIADMVDQNGELQPSDAVRTSATSLLDELVRYASALRPLRSAPADA